MRRWSTIAGVTLAVLLLLAAGGLRWVVAPSAAVLPADTDTTRTYAGTAAVLLNASALTSPAPGEVMLRDVPISVGHRTQVLGTKGSNALVSDAASIRAGDTKMAGVDYRYAVDRSTMERGSGYSGVVKQSGLTFNWPIRTRKKDYKGWVADTGRTTPLHYQGTAKRGEIRTYVFTTKSAPAPITDAQVLKALPSSLPKTTVGQLAAGLNLSADQLATLQGVLPILPDPVPFSYTYEVNATYWVAPASGVVVDVQEHEIRTLNIDVGGVSSPVTPVMDITFNSTSPTLDAAAKDARDDDKAINSIYNTIPLVLLIGGVVLLVIGVTGFAMGRRPRRSPAGPTPDATQAPQEPAEKT